MTTPKTMSQSQELALDMLRSMRLQENGAYRIPTGHLEALLNSADDSPQYQQQQPNMRQAELSAYLSWRRQMVQWCYRIADSCKFSKETVEISASLLDRYVATCPAIMLDAAYYQLSCMACLYTACKMNEPTCLSPLQMERISGCRFDNQALQQTEVKILAALQWRVNPPTAIAFSRSLLDSMEDQHVHFGITPESKTAILNAVELQIEQATSDELFLPIRASGIALAAVLNASRTHLPTATKLWEFEASLSKSMGYEIQTSYHRHQKIEKLQHALLALVAMSQGIELSPPNQDDQERDYYDCKMDEDLPSHKKSSLTDTSYFRPYSPRSVATPK